jgi:hypothetical protein
MGRLNTMSLRKKLVPETATEVTFPVEVRCSPTTITDFGQDGTQTQASDSRSQNLPFKLAGGQHATVWVNGIKLHYLPEECPVELTRAILDFWQSNRSEFHIQTESK